MHVCLSVCMSACRTACLHVCLHVCMSICMSACLFAYLHVWLHVCMSFACVYACLNQDKDVKYCLGCPVHDSTHPLQTKMMRRSIAQDVLSCDNTNRYKPSRNRLQSRDSGKACGLILVVKRGTRWGGGGEGSAALPAGYYGGIKRWGKQGMSWQPLTASAGAEAIFFYKRALHKTLYLKSLIKR